MSALQGNELLLYISHWDTQIFICCLMFRLHVMSIRTSLYENINIFPNQHNDGRMKMACGAKLYLERNKVSKQKCDHTSQRLIPYYIHVSTLINLESAIKFSQIIRMQFSFCLRVSPLVACVILDSKLVHSNCIWTDFRTITNTQNYMQMHH